ncbi:MAG: enoyl-CoA hydratase [Deltaproteobacteria bacterium]|nr:enoyl-CoA hydratase [Deltaproteobacteria bacterium]
MAHENILTSLEDGVFTLCISRAEKKNALTVAMYQAMVEALQEADADKKARCIVITGEGEMFTSGNDLMDFMNSPAAGPDSPVFQFLLTLVGLKTPLIAAVNGAGIGIGCTMLLHCDLVYAVENATLKLPFVPLGLCLEGGSSWLFPRMMGIQKASEFLFFGEKISVEEMEKFGLVNRVLPKEDFAEFVKERAQKLASLPAASLRVTKQLMRSEMDEDIRRILLSEGAEFAQLLPGDEAKEAFTAFFEKRAPDFKQFD